MSFHDEEEEEREEGGRKKKEKKKEETLGNKWPCQRPLWEIENELLHCIQRGPWGLFTMLYINISGTEYE